MITQRHFEKYVGHFFYTIVVFIDSVKEQLGIENEVLRKDVAYLSGIFEKLRDVFLRLQGNCTN